MRYRALLLFCSSLFAPACADEPSSQEPGAAPPPVTPMTMAGGVQHGDHNPHYGGVVWMQSNDLHFEVVLDPGGAHHVYFSDAIRVELPAAVASDVTITVRRTKGEPEERVELSVDDYGESWQGHGQPVGDDDEATAAVRFVYEGEPYELEFPFFTKPMDTMATDPHAVPP